MKNISRRVFLKGMAAGTLSIAAMGILSGCNSSSVTETAAEAVTETAAGERIYTPGTYTASAYGIGVVTVTMTFSESAITDIQVDTSDETEGIGWDKGEELAQQLLDAQSAKIDGVSGASVTSDAVKKAAENCIEQAQGLAEVSAEII